MAALPRATVALGAALATDLEADLATGLEGGAALRAGSWWAGL